MNVWSIKFGFFPICLEISLPTYNQKDRSNKGGIPLGLGVLIGAICFKVTSTFCENSIDYSSFISVVTT